MTSMSILNPVYRRDNMAPFYVLDNIFSAGELDRITAYCQQAGTEKAQVVQSRGTIVTDDKLRRSDIMMHRANLENKWIFDRVVEAFEMANRDAYNFDLDGFNQFQYSVYNDQGAHYEYHMDVSFASVSDRFLIGRKLSLSLMLNDESEFTGGEFQIIIDSGTIEKPITVPHKRGRFVFFPAFMVHRVAPVKSGVRKSLVFWALGPKFR